MSWSLICCALTSNGNLWILIPCSASVYMHGPYRLWRSSCSLSLALSTLLKWQWGQFSHAMRGPWCTGPYSCEAEDTSLSSGELFLCIYVGDSANKEDAEHDSSTLLSSSANLLQNPSSNERGGEEGGGRRWQREKVQERIENLFLW